MTDVIRLERCGALLDVILTDPDGGNLISNEEGAALVIALEALDPEVRIVRLRSSGDTFCLGRVSPMPKPGTPGITGDLIRQRVAEPALRVYAALAAVPVPVLAVVRGTAEGFGLGLVASCDIVLAGDRARFGISEMARDIPPTLVMTALLGRAPLKAVMHMVLSQEVIDAAIAFQLGLVSTVVDNAALAPEAEALVARILSYRPEAVRAIKDYARFANPADRPAAASLAANLAGTALSVRFGGTA